MTMTKQRVGIIIPTYNGGRLWQQVAASLKTITPLVDKILVVDSSSTDDTVEVAKENGFDVMVIESSAFNHGGTRNFALNQVDCDIAIFLTQDAIPQADNLLNIIKAFDNPKVALAYGRQLPHVNASPIAQHARYFNYKAQSYESDLSLKSQLGIKAVFSSNSFAAYRVCAFNEIGGFPEKTILSEDMYFAAKALLAGYKLAYVADACVYHSHNYTPKQEFNRYFDIGVFHCDEPWINQTFGGAGNEGKNFMLSEMKYLFRHNPIWVPVAFINNACKFLGYKLGKNYFRLSPKMREKCSMHKSFWRT